MLLLERSKELHPSLVEVYTAFQEDYIHPVCPHAFPLSQLLPVVVCTDPFCFMLQQARKAWAGLCSHLQSYLNVRKDLKTRASC